MTNIEKAIKRIEKELHVPVKQADGMLSVYGYDTVIFVTIPDEGENVWEVNHYNKIEGGSDHSMNNIEWDENKIADEVEYKQVKKVIDYINERLS